MDIQKVCVIGAGIMGSGIAQVMAEAGLEVVICDIEERFLEKGLASIRNNLNRTVAKGKIESAAAESIMGRIWKTIDVREAVGGAELIVEAAPELMDVKKNLFKKIDAIARPETIFASNTSGLSITEIASATKRQTAFIGMHFFNPVPVMKLVELTKGFLTSSQTFEICRALVEWIGKTPIEIKEAPGFAVNRILCPMINEAIFAFSEGVASAEDIDRAMVLGANHPIGPLALADMVGLDTLLQVMEGLHMELGEAKYRPAPLLRKMVRAGYFGRKSGKGFYGY